jgi:Tol biopolymer transport system component
MLENDGRDTTTFYTYDNALGLLRDLMYHAGSARFVAEAAASAIDLWVIDTAGTRTPLMSAPLPATALRLPHPSVDGEWIYFHGTPTGGSGTEIWRVRWNGSDAERIGPAAAGGSIDAEPSPSPDGTKLVYRTSRDGGHLVVRDLNTGDTLHIGGPEDRTPRWSPRADLIAVVDTAGRVAVMAPDGTARRTLASDRRFHIGPPTWSPDGAWLTLRNISYGLRIINVDTNEHVAVPMLADLWYPLFLFLR